ncbi:Hypersensitive-induced response protein-like protein 2 [Durusdinium trenchii]|uniref:Hypersensitive-induced response protein-like protein 2 n=1 Tax=Durusdinium trenchii TaxID=1381693 RepID=A0ABP0LFC1_9DINO
MLSVCFPFVTVTGCSLAVNQSQCRSDCKTKDNVTVTVVTAVQYRIQKDMVKVAVFDIASPQAQIAAEVDSVLRSTLPTMTLDESYAAKEKMVEEILPSVREAMGRYGYDILNVLITDIQPERSVLDAMNEINASRRQREAAFEKGEADKLLKIKASEADAEAKRLAGVGKPETRHAAIVVHDKFDVKSLLLAKDKAKDFVHTGTMRAAACVVNVANRPTGEVVGEEALRLAESEGGKALMKAEHRVWPDSFIRYWNPKSPVALSLFVVIFKGLF